MLANNSEYLSLLKKLEHDLKLKLYSSRNYNDNVDDILSLIDSQINIVNTILSKAESEHKTIAKDIENYYKKSVKYLEKYLKLLISQKEFVKKNQANKFLSYLGKEVNKFSNESSDLDFRELKDIFSSVNSLPAKLKSFMSRRSFLKSAALIVVLMSSQVAKGNLSAGLNSNQAKIVSNIKAHKFVEVVASSLNLREGPMTSHKILGKLSRGTRLEVLAKVNNDEGLWLLVKTNVGKAWIAANYRGKVYVKLISESSASGDKIIKSSKVETIWRVTSDKELCAIAKSNLNAFEYACFTYIGNHEGCVTGIYKDPSRRGNKAIGIGHNVDKLSSEHLFRKALSEVNIADVKAGKVILSKEQIIRLFKADLAETIVKARDLFPRLNSYPGYFQIALLDGVFRAEHKKEHKTVEGINEGNLIKAIKNYPDRDDYREKVGIRKRIDENLKFYYRYAKELGQIK